MYLYMQYAKKMKVSDRNMNLQFSPNTCPLGIKPLRNGESHNPHTVIIQESDAGSQ